MRNFDYGKLKDALWSTEIVGYISQIRLMQGRQEQFFRRPEELKRLVEIAKVQSTEASNAIEGIRTTNTRLKQLVEEKTTPKNRDEEEIAGYRDILNLIHESYEYIPLTPNYILQLHRILFAHSVKGTGFGGKFKSVQNYITTTDEDGHTVTLFTPLPPHETPAAVEAICNSFNEAIAHGEVEPLILIPMFVHDFLCIHPFLDGNGRMSRLLTTLLLYRCGFYVGKYISLEAKIAKYKDMYYDALAKSQEGWHEEKEDAAPFVKYLLTTILSAYRDFEERVDLVSENASALNTVRQAVKQRVGKFKKADILELCPTLGKSSVEKSLKELTRRGELAMHGTGRATFYTRISS